MLFTSIQTCYFPMRKDELKSRLIGRHVNIHNMDFEVFEKGRKLSIVPHAEQVNSIKTLPITSVVLDEEGDKTKVVMTSKMRLLDTGGPLLIITFCSFIFLASLVLLKVYREPSLDYTLMGLSLCVLVLFAIRLQTGYFDYVHKVRSYVKSKAGGNSIPFA